MIFADRWPSHMGWLVMVESPVMGRQYRIQVLVPDHEAARLRTDGICPIYAAIVSCLEQLEELCKSC